MRRIWYQCAEFLLVLLGMGWLFAPNTGLDVVFLLAWDVLAVAVIVTRWLRIRRYRAAADGEPVWLTSLLGRRSSFASTLLVSVVGLTAGGLILVANAVAEEDDELAFVLQVSAVPAVLAAWILLHFGYADRYAHLHHRAAPGLRFPATEQPNLLDFAYFAFTVGTSFATSDVEVQARPIRYTVLTHSLVSFVYNTAILGIAVGVITGK
ncbi:Uncharacterized membrane protein [Amycolatopsis tolypomycina]|uniref:Uncharacterized membrane protein n=1 Tax=Amycolatopsis tolypomycina TaxID=208445 RepID=A0A1H4VPG4_9PSEU|nr:DUF1345 domain-containing protein [Amycolatopsis tolypomycina]SEC82448.1 Uncharacterized membrane protein [Amycolatopsis tolypomycina]